MYKVTRQIQSNKIKLYMWYVVIGSISKKY